jgi:hypothetical protein
MATSDLIDFLFANNLYSADSENLIRKMMTLIVIQIYDLL